MADHWTLLLNHHAGALHINPGITQMEQTARDMGLEVTITATASVAEMQATLRRLVRDGAHQVAVAGGDGTVGLAVQELVNTDTVLGIIPQGTANNFATALRLPQDLPSALRVLLDGQVRRVDVGEVCGRYFTEAAGVGFFADALALYGQGTNKSLWRACYAVGRLLLAFRPRHIRLTIDGATHVERAVMCTVANTYRMGSAAPLAPGAKVTDGELDLVVVGDLTRREIVPYYRAIRRQMHLNLPKVSSYRAREVTIESRRRMNVHADDQIVGTTPVTITACPGALRVMVERL